VADSAPESQRLWIPPAFAESDGLVGVGGSLDPATLLRAYAEGVFPWFNEGDPVLWWSPDPRAIIELDGLHISRSLTRTLRKQRFRITRNRAFTAVMRGCAENRPEGTWITPTMIDCYSQLHHLGHAHSVEVWLRSNAAETDRSADPPGDGWLLAGGIYGVAVGAMFSGESMFHRVTDASKVALVALVEHLRNRGFELFDVQMRTEHTARMGAIEIPRAIYLHRLQEAIRKQSVTFEPRIDLRNQSNHDFHE